MRLATIRHHGTTVCARVDSDTAATPIFGFADLGALLMKDDWKDRAAEASGEKITFGKTDLAPVVPSPQKVICVGLNYAQPH